MKTRIRLGLIMGAAGIAALLGGAAAPIAAANAASAPGPDSQPSLEETFDYPGRDKILAERRIRLDKGDGRIILLADCPQNLDGVLMIESDSLDENACFKIRSGDRGYLTMEIPDAKLIRGDKSHYVNAKVNGAEEPILVRPIGYTAILADLIELRVVPTPQNK